MMMSKDYRSSRTEAVCKGERLVIAAASGDLEELMELLESGISVDAEEYNRWLFYASQKYFTPLQKACENNHIECLKALISFEADVNVRDRFDVTAAHTCAQNGYVHCLELLIDAGADCNVPVKHSKKGCVATAPYVGGTTPLHLAAANNHVPCVKELIDSGADYNAIDEKGRTSLYIAAQNGYEECVLVHLRNAVSRDILSLPDFNNGSTPLHSAVKNGMVDCVKELLKAGSDPNHLDNAGLSPLHYAVMCDPNAGGSSEEILHLLVLKGYNTDINVVDKYGYTPLHYVAFSYGASTRRPNLVHFLLAYGADPYIEDERGYNIIENELKFPSGNWIITNSVVQTVLQLPNLDLSKCFGPLQPPRQGRNNNNNNNHHPQCRLFEYAVTRRRIDLQSVRYSVSVAENQPSHFRFAEVILEQQNDTPQDFSPSEPYIIDGFSESMPEHPQRDYASDQVHNAIEKMQISREDVKEKYLWYNEMASKPRSLLHCCRFYIRKNIGYQNLRSVKDLPLPPKLKKYLLLNFVCDVKSGSPCMI